MRKTGILKSLVGAAVIAAASTAGAQSTQGVTDTEIVLGSITDASGPMAAWGVPVRNGAIMAAEEVNAAGGIHGRKLRLVIEDSSFDPKKGVLATQKLIQQDKVFALYSVVGTPVAMASAPIAVDAGIPFMYPGASGRWMWDPMHKLRFTVAAPFDEQTKATIRYFAPTKKRVAIIYQDDDYGKDIRDATIAQAKASGLEVVADASYKRGDTVFSSQVARVRQANPDLVMLGTIIRETVGVMTEARKVGWNVDFVVAASGCNNAVIALGKEAVEGLYATCQFVPFDVENEPPVVKDWIGRYEKRFGIPIDHAALMGYDTMALMILGLQNAGRNLTVDSFVAGSEKIRDWQDIFGSPPQTFGPNRRHGTDTCILTQVRGGKFKRVAGPLK